MKKIIYILLIIMSTLTFAENYKVEIKQNVTLSQEEIKKNSDEISNFSLKTLNSLSKVYNSLLITEALNSLETLDEFNPFVKEQLTNESQKISKEILNIISYKIKKITYLSNNTAEVQLEVIYPNADSIDTSEEKISEVLSQILVNDKFVDKIDKLYETNQLEEDTIILELVLELMNIFKNEVLNAPLVSEVHTLNLKKVKNVWTIY